ncbi:DUF3293 domain-containing protein [Neiella marina]|uniref:DUF3293 domain-containing protein n=1 Tax=Neiella holothuriorum TaxID=2870530 RepID=A0ABS7EKM5_9GAMM|nr:DUF3293 domain-containing protein [Neiella holothuriorum]MBW8192913.1 DUF3293 domain-containing protein [Neiella holothuriorum]
MKNTWHLYSETVFSCNQWLPEDVTGFVITACNPRGELLLAPTNLLRNNVLLNELEFAGYRFRAMTGWAPDFSHGEAGWFVFADLAAGKALAQQFEQNAIYWVEQGTLNLYPVLLTEHTMTTLGRFRSRVRCV